MGFSDLASHVLSSCSFASRADQFSSCAKLVASIFFAAVLIGTWAWTPDFHSGGPHLLTTLLVNGTDSGFVPYPQITICPLWPMGSISNVHCVEGVRNSTNKTPLTLSTKTVLAGKFKDHPNWNCTTINWNGVIANNSHGGIWCQVNSTNYGNFSDSMAPTTWPGRIIVSVHEPGQLPDHCENCYDGVNFGIVEAQTTGLIFWAAHVFETVTQRAIEYRTIHNSLSKPAQLASVETSDMDFALGYYSPDVLVYREPNILAAAVGGERFSQFCILIGAVGFLSYLIFSCLRTTLILFFLGKDGFSHAERQPII